MLFGGLCGLAAAAAFVAGAPIVGRTPALPASMPMAAGGEARSARGAGASPVSAVLVPAIDAGVVPAPDPEGAAP